MEFHKHAAGQDEHGVMVEFAPHPEPSPIDGLHFKVHFTGRLP